MAETLVVASNFDQDLVCFRYVLNFLEPAIAADKQIDRMLASLETSRGKIPDRKMLQLGTWASPTFWVSVSRPQCRQPPPTGWRAMDKTKLAKGGPAKWKADRDFGMRLC